MPLKFLPFFQKKAKNQSPNLKESLQSEKQNEAFLNLGLNLLSKTSSNRNSIIFPENPNTLTSSFKKIILNIGILMIILVTINFLILYTINYLKIKQNSLVNEVKNYALVEETALSVDKRVTYYKKLLGLRRNISSKVEFVNKGISGDINIKDVKYTPKSFTLFADGPDAYAFTRLILEYLKDGVVPEITIKQARLNTRVNRFEIDMEGTFK